MRVNLLKADKNSSSVLAGIKEHLTWGHNLIKNETKSGSELYLGKIHVV